MNPNWLYADFVHRWGAERGTRMSFILLSTYTDAPARYKCTVTRASHEFVFEGGGKEVYLWGLKDVMPNESDDYDKAKNAFLEMIASVA